MSCEGNRLKFFEQVQASLGLDAKTLEHIYQAGKAKGVQPGEQERVTQKTRLLFADMQAVGVKPPTHSADGLPKMESRAGYAAVFDHLRQNAPPRFPGLMAEYKGKEEDWPFPISPVNLLKDGLFNNEGFLDHHYLPDRNKKFHNVWAGYWNREHHDTRFKMLTGVTGRDLDSSNPRRKKEKEEEKKKVAEFTRVDANGLLPDGYSPEGFDAQGFDALGYSLYGLTRAEMQDPEAVRRAASTRRVLESPFRTRTKIKTPLDVEGFMEDGFRTLNEDPHQDLDRFGFNRLGFKGGRSWTGYDEKGLDAQGKPAPKIKGYDAWGYKRDDGLTAPDAAGRRYNLIGWVYDPDTDECYDPLDPKRRMKHSGSWAYSAKFKKVVLKRSYVPTEKEMEARVRNPSIRWNEYRNGGAPLFPYGALATRDQIALWLLNRPEVRYARSARRLADEPGASLFGALLRCPKCGQFTGARPHQCPHYGNRRVLAFASGMVVAFERGGFFPKLVKQNNNDEKLGKFGRKNILAMTFTDVYDQMLYALDQIYASFYPQIDENSLPEKEKYHFTYATPLDRVADALWQKADDEVAVVLEAPNSPLGKEFDWEYHGGPLAGYHWKSGLSREGYDPLGFHYLSSKTRDGVDFRSLQSMQRLKSMMKEASELLAAKGKTAKDVLEATYSRIASALAGAPRRVTIEERGGPRPGMFWTDMRGRINAERYPLRRTPHDSETNNLLAMKAGIYHELGHEEDTPPGIFARVLEIANGKEEVDGIPKAAAGLVAEVYNILEDGRMERVQAKRRRGTAAILAADALINPRWDEKVGEDVPVPHQVMGLMLYRSLPFFRVRQEVLDAAPQRVRDLYREVEPLVDRAMNSPQDAFQSSIEITRRLIEKDESLRQLAEQMTAQRSQGGKWVQAQEQDGQGGATLIISAMPNLGGDVSPDRTLVIPGRGGQAGTQDEPQGQGRSGQAGTQDEPQGQGRSGQGQTQDESQGQGRSGQAGTQDEPQGQGRNGQAGTQDEPQGQGRGGQADDNVQSAASGSGGAGVLVAAEPDEAFFSSVSSGVQIDAVFDSLTSDLRQGVNSFLRSPVGKMLQKPLDAVGDIILDEPDSENTYTIKIPSGTPGAQLGKIRSKAKAEGQRVARRLEVLKEEIHKRVRLQSSGAVDRKRFKRAVAGAENVYRQDRSQDITSLAVSIQLDMSGSMGSEVSSGKLAGAALALEEALQRLDAEYMVSGFGTEYALFKSFGDRRIRDEQAAAMLKTELGGTNGAPAMRLGLLGLKETRSANKLHVVMTDGEFFDTPKMIEQAAEMRRNGILPFGIYFKKGDSHPPSYTMNQIFGKGGWVVMTSLSDLSEVVARRIEQIYRKILATR